MSRFRAAAAVGIIALVAVGCAKTKDTGFPPANFTPEASATPTGGFFTGAVDVIDNDFNPREITVKVGTTVDWKQSGSAPHSVTADDGSFASGPCLQDPSKCMQKGSTFEHAFPTAGTFPYYCVIHGAKGGLGMHGIVKVVAG